MQNYKNIGKKLEIYKEKTLQDNKIIEVSVQNKMEKNIKHIK